MLYHETAKILLASPADLRARIYNHHGALGSPASQVYALAVETCKWSPLLKEVVERAGLLGAERKLTPVLAVLLVHDLLLTRHGVQLPAGHGLRTAVERHKARLQAELTRSRVRRQCATLEDLRAQVDAGAFATDTTAGLPYPRWIRINTLKTSLEDQLATTFADYELVTAMADVRQRRRKVLCIDAHVPNLVAVSPMQDLTKTRAYASGELILQDKASCFPAYLLDPLISDGDLVDACSAPGNKTTHLAAILIAHQTHRDDCAQTIHAFEKDKQRAVTLEKMVNLAGSAAWTKVHPGQDFLQVDPSSLVYKDVGALLLDPSCSGSGIVERDQTSDLHLPSMTDATTSGKQKKLGVKVAKSTAKVPESAAMGKRKREDEATQTFIGDDDEVIVVGSLQEQEQRLAKLAAFQLKLLLHAFRFPGAYKVTYSTCSVHAQENEEVVLQALQSDLTKKLGWRLLTRAEQIRGLRSWPVRGDVRACAGNEAVAESCIRTNKGDEHATMGFFVAAFTRDGAPLSRNMEGRFERDEHGHVVRDILGVPVLKDEVKPTSTSGPAAAEDEEEWNGFGD